MIQAELNGFERKPPQRVKEIAKQPVQPIDTIPCPWASGQLDTLPPGVNWDDPIMDPMSGGFPMITFNAPSVAQEVAA